MKKIGLILGLGLYSTLTLATPIYSYMTIGNDMVTKTSNFLGKDAQFISSNDIVTVMKIPTFKAFNVSNFMHTEKMSCPGFMLHETQSEANDYAKNAKSGVALNLVDYTIDQEETVKSYMAQVKEETLLATITKLSSFLNRYYKSETGVQSQTWLKNYWGELLQGRNDAKVEFYKHAKWSQPSVIATIEGSTYPNEIIVLGGHADSIGGGGQSSNLKMKAPGADDNASGIATLTEIMRVAIQNNFKPARTIMFMGYSGEEVGLLGSKEIASSFKKAGKNVIGVMQLDMTGFKGSAQDILLMSDFSNARQNEFLGTLIDKYVKVPWGYSKCGYGCSDHASWTANGYPASIPFESKMEEYNRKIHTADDTVKTLNNSAAHSAKFAKVGLAYMVEMAKE
ncbi:MAG: M20/M25/M40 family metallo-hydrolase [Bacteriovoracaceae bacterium]